MTEKVLIIIPTYNEIENISKMIKYIRENYPDIYILVVDDNSPDGTGDYVENITKTDDKVKLIRRSGKLGLGTAYVKGFKYAIENKYDYIFEMDADFSHDPAEIKNFLIAIQNADLVLGSRYINGVNVINWPMKRLLLSYFANYYTRLVTGMPIKDATGGFKCFRRKVLENIDLSKIKSNGYSFQIEMTFKAWVKGFKIVEIPIIFVDRVQGVSKMSKKIVREAVLMVWKLRLLKIFGKIK
ncbi:MAG TPA: polyprenol monophosphomannose synthase [Ignavibacteriales bacterium]|jgi:dolichol-phosphate mannosyltransferase|nr:polyprenol monophosphomannose synthase [Ignavibacteriales bacterium]